MTAEKHSVAVPSLYMRFTARTRLICLSRGKLTQKSRIIHALFVAYLCRVQFALSKDPAIIRVEDEVVVNSLEISQFQVLLISHDSKVLARHDGPSYCRFVAASNCGSEPCCCVPKSLCRPYDVLLSGGRSRQRLKIAAQTK